MSWKKLMAHILLLPIYADLLLALICISPFLIIFWAFLTVTGG